MFMYYQLQSFGSEKKLKREVYEELHSDCLHTMLGNLMLILTQHFQVFYHYTHTQKSRSGHVGTQKYMHDPHRVTQRKTYTWHLYDGDLWTGCTGNEVK